MSQGRVYKFLIFHGIQRYLSYNLSILIILEDVEREINTPTYRNSTYFIKQFFFFMIEKVFVTRISWLFQIVFRFIMIKLEAFR